MCCRPCRSRAASAGTAQTRTRLLVASVPDGCVCRVCVADEFYASHALLESVTYGRWQRRHTEDDRMYPRGLWTSGLAPQEGSFTAVEKNGFDDRNGP